MMHGRLMLPEEIESMGREIKLLDSIFFGGRKTVAIAVDEPELILKEGEPSNGIHSESSAAESET